MSRSSACWCLRRRAFKGSRLQGSTSVAAFLELLLQLLWIRQKVADLTPYYCFQKLSLDLPIAANAFAPKAVAIRASHR